jgi:type VI secretion system secreted protein Hcp
MPEPFFVTITGKKSGAIKGSCDASGHKDEILGQALEHKVEMPRNPQTGLPTGRRVHGPLTITKYFDVSSPVLFSALCSGEQMSDVKCSFWKKKEDGGEEEYYRISLKNAIIVAIRPWISNVLLEQNERLQHMEDVSFTYESIKWEHTLGSKEASDSWTGQ